MARDGDPQHPILPEAWTYEIIAIRLERAPADGTEPYLDLTVRRGAERRQLRFWSPQNLSIEEGGPTVTHGLMILDIRHRGLEGLGVRVDDFEGTQGAVRFWARAVEELR